MKANTKKYRSQGSTRSFSSNSSSECSDDGSSYCDGSAITEDNIYLAYSSTVSEARRKGSSTNQRKTIALSPAINCDRMTSMQKIQGQSSSKHSVYGSPYEFNGSNSLTGSPLSAPVMTSKIQAGKESRDSSPSRIPKLKQSMKVTLDDFDINHLKIQNETHDDEDSSEEGEEWIVRKLKKNSPELYWLQLTKEIEDSRRLVQAIQSNTYVRNVTAYSCALEKLSSEQKHDLVDAICRMPNLKNLIVFQDCGSIFLDPLIKYRPPLMRLTLYKLDFSEHYVLQKLMNLIGGLPTLEDLSLEKYHATDTDKLFKAMSGVILHTSSLKSLSMTPKRNLKISSDGLYALIKALKKNTTIRNLALQGCDRSMDTKCIKMLADVLETNSRIGDIAFTGFFKSEEEFWNRYPKELTAQIQLYLNLNKSGVRTLQMDVNATFDTMKNVLLSQRGNVDSVYYLISNNPQVVTAMS